MHFNSERKIKQIRLYWDQASLLKSVDVIGARAKTWPIKDGKDQIRLITSSTKAADIQSSSTTTSRRPSTSRPTKDPHGTLEPFAANIPEENEGSFQFDTPAVKPRSSAKPAAREWEELFVNEQAITQAGFSPSKANVIAPKIGAGKNYKENRLFGDAQSPSDEIEAKFISPHPTKYHHFEFDDGHNNGPPKPAAPRPKTKHQSQLDFSDTTTPTRPTQRRQDQRSFAFEDQTPEHSPVRRPFAPQPRRDADTHFELQDDGELEHPRNSGQTRGQQSAQINNKTLFSNNVIGEEGALDTSDRGRPVSTIATTKDRQKDFGNHWETIDNPTHGDEKKVGLGTNIKDRHKDFDPHFKMTDSPGGGEKKEEKKPLGENQSKAVRSMQANWESSDPSPHGKENRLMTIAGNGMGGRKGVVRQWGLGDHDQPTQQPRPVRKNMSNQRSELWGS